MVVGMRRAFVVFVLVIALAACGGDRDDAEPPPSSTATSTPTEAEPTATATPEATSRSGPVDTFERFLAAAGEADAQAMWAMFSSSAREAFGPTHADFAARHVSAFEEGAGTWSQADYDVIVDERIDETAVVAIAGRRTAEGQTSHDVYAVPLRVEDGDWKIALGGEASVLAFEPLASQPARVARPRITATFASRSPAGEARLWLDGREMSPELQTRGSQAIVSARPATALEPGNHSVVVFVAADGQPTVSGWSFAVAGP